MVKRLDKPSQGDFIKFLGTAGARFVMIRQLRASGGLWVSYKGTNVLIDPGPGSIVRCASSRPRLDPGKLDGIILTHRHLDHANDVNVMIEAMTEGGFKKRGVLFCPGDAIGEDPVLLRHTRAFLEKIEILEADKTYSVGDFSFQTSMKHIHPVSTYGLKFKLKNTSVSLLTDTRYFKELSDFYKTDILIICVVFFEPRAEIDHLSLLDAETLIRDIRPRKAILTHFGMTMLKAKPHIQAEELSKKLGIEVLAAYDGMALDF
ncbi:MAG: MBL fold metallo-hydrolase [Candidatus Omnitrophica bacterium]|nr:MBL fold metallo-hydrolase [Candidatus Omnitrophota bacterium]MDD5592023.1 MBL fold metallo-hydrolase [Candidatus Omnitrophota bacterium]